MIVKFKIGDKIYYKTGYGKVYGTIYKITKSAILSSNMIWAHWIPDGNGWMPSTSCHLQEDKPKHNLPSWF